MQKRNAWLLITCMIIATPHKKLCQHTICIFFILH